MSQNELLTSGQVAERCGVNRSTVHHWAKDGKLVVAETVNGIRLFRASDVDAYTASRDAAEVSS